ncbi:MAG: PaaI family thioesterase [Parasphingopyxis sp.]
MSEADEQPMGMRRWVVLEEDPDNPGWSLWKMRVKGRFLDIFGPVRLKKEGENSVRCRVDTEMRHANGFEAVHGGFLMAVVDQSLFWTCHYLDKFAGGGGVTLDASTHFMGSPKAGEPIDAVVEILKETGRLIFLRGMIEQDGEPVASFTGTLRKVRRKPAAK